MFDNLFALVGPMCSAAMLLFVVAALAIVPVSETAPCPHLHSK